MASKTGFNLVSDYCLKCCNQKRISKSLSQFGGRGRYACTLDPAWFQLAGYARWVDVSGGAMSIGLKNVQHWHSSKWNFVTADSVQRMFGLRPRVHALDRSCILPNQFGLYFPPFFCKLFIDIAPRANGETCWCSGHESTKKLVEENKKRLERLALELNCGILSILFSLVLILLFIGLAGLVSRWVSSILFITFFSQHDSLFVCCNICLGLVSTIRCWLSVFIIARL